VDWLAVLRRIKRSGYRGYVGFECVPSGSPDAALEAVQALWATI